MTTLNATYARRAITRLAAPDAVAPAREEAPWARLRLPLPAPVDSRGSRALLSTSVRLDWARALETLGLVAAAIGLVALLATLCR